MRRFLLSALTTLVLCVTLGVFLSSAYAKPPKHMLVVTVTKGYRHDSIAVAETTLQTLADESRGAFVVDYARTDADIQAKMTAVALKNYDAVFFANTTGDLPLPDRDGFLAWIRAGHGFIGAHAAADTFRGNAPFRKMLGGEFLTHGAQVSVTAIVDDKKHPATKAFKTPTFAVFDEIYEFQHFDPRRVHALLSMNAHPQTKAPGDYPIAWCRTEGKGRVFYTSFGHRDDIWQAPWYRTHLMGGILWTLGLRKGDATPGKITTK